MKILKAGTIFEVNRVRIKWLDMQKYSMFLFDVLFMQIITVTVMICKRLNDRHTASMKIIKINELETDYYFVEKPEGKMGGL